MSYPAPLWSALEDVLKPQHIFAQNTEESVYIRFLNLDSATVPFFSLMLAFLPNFLSGWFLAFARQVKECLQLPGRKQRFERRHRGPLGSCSEMGQVQPPLQDPALAAATPLRRNDHKRARETTGLQHRLALTSGSPFLHLMLKAVEQQRWQKNQKHL